jgi:hypothetical protein
LTVDLSRAMPIYDGTMLRALFFLLAPILAIALVYFFGWWALVGCVVLVFCTLLFLSAGEHEIPKRKDPEGGAQAGDERVSSLGPATGF